MKILLVCEGYSIFTTYLWENIKKYDPSVKISLLTNKSGEREYRDCLSLDEGEEIYAGGDSAFASIPGFFVIINRMPRFDIIQVLWMEMHWGALASSLKHRTKHIYISVGGSDLYRRARKKWVACLQKRLIRRASVVSSENSNTRDYFYSKYGEWTRNIPHHIVRFGVDVIDELASQDDWDTAELHEKWGLPRDKYVIMLGHNGHEQHQHIDMISAVERMNPEILKKCFFLIPMTYGTPGPEYREAVENAIRHVTPDYKILDDFMNTTEMAETTIVTDIMVHMQTTDQLSSTMMAHLYGENVVLAGSWLPYSDIKDKGIVLYDVEDFEQLTSQLEDVVDHFEDYKKECADNKDKAYEFSSWKYCIKGWFGIYESLMK